MNKKNWIERTPSKIKDIYVPGKELNFLWKKNQNWLTAGYLKGNNLQKSEKFSQNAGFFASDRDYAKST